MFISIVVPVYNVVDKIDACIKALLNQDYSSDSYEIILVDNNSNDGSVEICQSYNDVTLLFESKQGSYAARNKGIKHAKGDIIAFIDSDCTAGVSWLSAIADAFKCDLTQVVLGERVFNSNSKWLNLFIEYEYEKAQFIYTGSDHGIYYGYAGNMGVRKSLFSKVGLFVEQKRGSDTVFIQQVLRDYSTQSVEYRRMMCVKHLEIQSVRDLCRKKYVYGYSNEMSRQSGTYEPLSSNTRWLILKKVVQSQSLGITWQLRLLLMLLLGMFYHETGRFKGVVSKRLRPNKS